MMPDNCTALTRQIAEHGPESGGRPEPEGYRDRGRGRLFLLSPLLKRLQRRALIGVFTLHRELDGALT
jgi:hypothetical protein